MSKVFSTFAFTLLIATLSTSPLPSIPLVILNYKINGLLLGYIATLIGGLIASINQFFISRKLALPVLKKRFPNKYKFIIKYSNIISEMNRFEFLLLLLSGVIPNSIISVASGLSRIKFNRFINCLIVVSIPQQFIFLIAASQIGNVENFLKIRGINNINSVIFTISILSFSAFLISYFIRFLPKLIGSFNSKN
jgi:uncharacterized membrane protein YdjX (TVP38/TMEM64 family)